MCGLCGLALDDPAQSPDRELMLTAARTLHLRGPDDEGVHVLGPLAIAFRRLSIIDVAGGHQPIENETRDIAIVLLRYVAAYSVLIGAVLAAAACLRCSNSILRRSSCPR